MKWSEVKRPETPGDRIRIDTIKEAMAEAERLYELRKARAVTQVELAARLGVSQGSISALEHRDDLFVSTLRDYVEALGGRLVLEAVFDDDAHPIAVG